MNDKEIPIYSPHMLAQACFGVFIGVLFAQLAVKFLLLKFGNMQPTADVLDNFLMTPKIPEKLLYIFSLSFGSIGAYLVTMSRVKLHKLFWLVLITSVPFINQVSDDLLGIKTYNYQSVLICLLIPIFIYYFYYHYSKKEIGNKKQIVITSFRFNHAKLPNFLVVCAITLILLPESFTRIAAHIASSSFIWTSHIVSFLLGPALYFFGDHLLPGVDYFSQYSIGMGWIFSFMLGKSAEAAFLHYTSLVILTTWLFYIHIFYLLSWLYKSWLPAAIVALLSLIMLFNGDTQFVTPSTQGVLRYPLIGIVAWILLLFNKRPTSILLAICLAFTLAFSIFLNTETGIITIIAFNASLLLTRTRLGWHSSIMVNVFSLIIFFALLYFIFGKNIFQINFLYSIIEPLMLYGHQGMGGVIIAWSLHDFYWFYNLIAPGIAIALLGLIAQQSRLKLLIENERLSVLAFFTVTGLLMIFKYINMSLAGIWQVNALCLLIPFAWCMTSIIRAFKERGAPYSIFAKCLALICILGACSIAAFSKDVQIGNRVFKPLGLQSWRLYPSLIKKWVYKHKKHSGCYSFNCYAKPAPKDIQLIQARTLPHQQVAIISELDWAYLLNAHRPPLLFFLPSTSIFTKRIRAESMRRLEKTKYVFVPRSEGFEPIINSLIPHFKENFVPDGVGERLMAWKRKKGLFNDNQQGKART